MPDSSEDLSDDAGAQIPPPPPPPPGTLSAEPPAPPPPGTLSAEPPPPPPRASSPTEAALPLPLPLTELPEVAPPPAPPVAAAEPASTPPPPAVAAHPQPASPPAPTMPTAEVSDGPADGHNIGLSYAALGMSAKRSGRTALAVLAAILEPGERVEALAVGRYRGHNGVVASTDRSLLFVNDREWEPIVLRVATAADLTVTGWQNDRKAALVFESEGVHEVIDSIGEREMAQRLAESVRAKVGG